MPKDYPGPQSDDDLCFFVVKILNSNQLFSFALEFPTSTISYNESNATFSSNNLYSYPWVRMFLRYNGEYLHKMITGYSKPTIKEDASIKLRARTYQSLSSPGNPCERNVRYTLWYREKEIIDAHILTPQIIILCLGRESTFVPQTSFVPTLYSGNKEVQLAYTHEHLSTIFFAEKETSARIEQIDSLEYRVSLPNPSDDNLNIESSFYKSDDFWMSSNDNSIGGGCFGVHPYVLW